MKSKVEVLKRVAATTYWGLSSNSPLLRESYSEPSARVRLSPPGDCRPSLGFHMKLFLRTVEDYFGSANAAWRVLPRRKTVLANKIQYPDHAEEIVVDGQVVGHFIYDVSHGVRRWRFRPLYALVSRMVEEEAGYFAIVDAPKLSRGYVFKKDRLLKKNLPERRDEYVALATRDMRYLGVGAVLRGERVYVLKSWTRRPYSFGDKDPSILEVVRHNEETLRELEEEAVAFVQSIHEKYRLPVVVSFSGGKDSLVTLKIAVEALGPEKVTILFNNTGIEFPETVRYVYHVAESMGVKLLVADAGDAFWRAVRVFGPPARDYRWCCKVAKLAPIGRLVKENFPDGVLSLVGQRRFESASRALSPRVWRNIWLPKVIAASPILDWTALAVWLYIYWRRLPVNKLYYMGFDRLGCWLCPAVELGELDLLEKWERNLAQTWSSYLLYFASSKGLPRAWVDMGLWRWVSPPRDILRVSGDIRLPEGRDQAALLIRESSTRYVLRPGHPSEVKPSKLLNMLSSLPLLKEKIAAVEEVGGYLLITMKQPLTEEEVKELEKASLRAYSCVQCMECATWCPQQAIARDPEGGVRILEDRCSGCGLCSKKCPLAEYVPRARETTGKARVS
uniref:4Fe-4S dicluster domain-containing protein n=1 Tax=Thermofilum pendens TaxID=2269 RepID=A0A7J3X7V8_THEPE